MVVSNFDLCEWYALLCAIAESNIQLSQLTVTGTLTKILSFFKLHGMLRHAVNTRPHILIHSRLSPLIHVIYCGYIVPYARNIPYERKSYMRYVLFNAVAFLSDGTFLG